MKSATKYLVFFAVILSLLLLMVPAVTIEAVPMTITTPSPLNSGEVGVFYLQVLSVVGGKAPYNWSMVGTLPAGLFFSPDGNIRGTPTTAGGPTAITFTVTDSQSNFATKELSISICSHVTITTESLAYGEVNVAYFKSLAAGGGIAPYTWDIVSGTLPAGLNLSSSGTITGLSTTTCPPTEVVFRATDSLGAIATKSLFIGIFPHWYFVMTIIGHSPIDLMVTDPDGLIISKLVNQISGATYNVIDVDGDGDLDVQVDIPYPKIGRYLTAVIPKPGVLPTETYTLEVSLFGKTVIVAKDVQIANIPEEPYQIFSTSGGVSLQPTPVPGLSMWGIAVMTIFFAGTSMWVLRNRRKQVRI